MRYVDNFVDEFTKFEDNVDRIHVRDVNCDEFIEKYEKIYKPVCILGVQVRHYCRGKIVLFVNLVT